MTDDYHTRPRVLGRPEGGVDHRRQPAPPGDRHGQPSSHGGSPRRRRRGDEVFHLRLEAEPVGWAVAFEVAVKAQVVGLKLGEVPIISIDRLYGGKSTFRLRPWCFEYLPWFVWGVIALRRARRAGR